MAENEKFTSFDNINLCPERCGDNVDETCCSDKYVPNHASGDTPRGPEEACKKSEKKEKAVKDREMTTATPEECTAVYDGTILAGPGEDRRIIYFDVKAFFGDHRHIKNVGRDHNMSYRISGDAQIMRDILKAHGFIEMPFKSQYNNFSWIGNSISELCIDQLLPYQIINHFVGSTSLTRKDKLYENISKMKRKKGALSFDFVPVSFVLPRELKHFTAYHNKHPGPFIVKPVGLSRGRGVYLIGNPSEIVNANEEQVVSKYLKNPLLIDGYKVDLRIYVLVTSFNPLVIYIYQEGLTRFATVKYKNDLNNLHALRMHLTNYSINVSSGNYVRNEDSCLEDFGSKWTLSALLRYFHGNGIDTLGLMRNIEDVIIKTILAAEKPIATGCRIYQRKPSNCFELFGFDIMLDENYKPWLLEVNLSPSLVCTTPLDIKVKGNMLCDLLNLVGIETYEKKKPRESNSCSSNFSSYIHRTVGYYCLCVIRDEFRQLLRLHRKRKRYNKIMATYKGKEKSAASTTEPSEVERKRTKYLSNLSSKERAMVSRVQNEMKRSGGWVKIFPTVDSWCKYKSFMLYRTVKNVILHQSIYPNQHFKSTRTKEYSRGTRPSESELALLQNTKWYHKFARKEVGPGLKEMLQRLSRYHSSLEIGPPPLFTVRPTNRDFGKTEEDLIREDALKRSLLNQIRHGCLLNEVQARTAFQRYLTYLKQILRNCQCAVKTPTTYPSTSVVQDLLFKFLGQSSELIIDRAQYSTGYTLDFCLTNFIYHYHKETRQLISQRDSPTHSKGDNSHKKTDTKRRVTPELFEEFMHSADQWDIEDLLVTYLKIHGDATLFLKNRILNKPPNCPSYGWRRSLL